MQSLVSIIIPTYNRSSLLGATLDSILLQTYSKWECIVVDDGSSDYTKELMTFYVTRDERIKFFIRPPHSTKGANSCRNYGFEKSSGDLINWFDSDDLLASDYLHEQIQSINLGGSDGSISDFSVFKKEEKAPLAVIENKTSNEHILEDFISGKINPAIQGIVLKRDVIENQLFDTKLTWADDLDFLFRILKKRNIKFNFLRGSKVLLRRHEESLTGNYYAFDLKGIKSELEVRRNILLYAHVSGYERRIVSSALEMYFRGFKMLFLSHSWKSIKEELTHIKNIFPVKRKYKLWEVKLYGFYLLQRSKYIRRYYQEHIRKFDTCLYFFLVVCWISLAAS